MFSACKTYEKQLRIEKTRLSHQVWSHGGSTFKKKRTLNGHFSRPAETDPYVDSFTKKWAGVPKSATNAIIHSEQGLDIPSISTKYTETHDVSHARTRLHGDHIHRLRDQREN